MPRDTREHDDQHGEGGMPDVRYCEKCDRSFSIPNIEECGLCHFDFCMDCMPDHYCDDVDEEWEDEEDDEDE